MSYPTVLAFITQTMVDIGALIQGQTPNNTEALFIFNALNDMNDEFAADRLMLYTQPEAVLNLTTKQTYQIGPGGADFPSQPRPVRIDVASMIVPGTTIHLPLKLLNYGEWEMVTERGRNGAVIDALYCDYAYPYANLNVTPIPTGTPQLALIFRALLTQFVTLQDPFSFPPAYTQMLLKNLGVRIAPSFRSPLVDQAYMQLAMETRVGVQRMNADVLQNSVAQGLSAPIPAGAPPALSPHPAPVEQQAG